MLDLLNQLAPPSASPDCTLAQISINYSDGLARYRHMICLIHGLRSYYQQFYSFYSGAHFARVGLGEQILKL